MVLLTLLLGLWAWEGMGSDQVAPPVDEGGQVQAYDGGTGYPPPKP